MVLGTFEKALWEWDALLQEIIQPVVSLWYLVC